MSATKMLFLAALAFATVSCRSFEKRSPEADANPDFLQTFKDGSFSQSYDCSGPAGCGAARPLSSNPSSPSVINQQYNQGSSDPFNNDFFNQFQQWRRRRSADADPGFKQTFQSGSISQSYDCTGPNGCGEGVGRVTHNTQNIQNHAAEFNQWYNGGSSAVNIDHKKKRSAEADAAPGFTQNFESGSFSQSYDCTGPNGCGEGVGRVTYNTQNVKNIADSFRQQYNGGSSAVNIDHGRKKRSPTPGFQQTYLAGSHYENIDSTGASTGMQTWTGGQSIPYSGEENNGNQYSTNHQLNGNYPSNNYQATGNKPNNHYQANGNQPSNNNQAYGNHHSNHNQGTGNYPSNHNHANGNSGSGFEQTYMSGSHYENIDSTGATTGVHTVGGGSDNSGISYPSNHYQANSNYPSVHSQANTNSGHHQVNGNYASDYDQANENDSSNHNQATGNSGSGFQQTYMSGSHYENIDSTGATTGMHTVGGRDNHDSRYGNYQSDNGYSNSYAGNQGHHNSQYI